MKKIFSIAVILLAVIMVWQGCKKKEETGEIYGTVTDYATGEPVKNANVKLRPTGTTIQTGSDGTYSFQDIKPGEYSLSLSKAEYEDLDDDYVISVSAGKRESRDVQMKKQVALLRITDMNGNDITTLDFGSEMALTSKSFNIFNETPVNITCQLSHNCNWITSVTSLSAPIASGQTVPIVVTIDRMLLAGGENSTILHINSNNGANELTIKAVGVGSTSVTTADITNITATTAVCGGNISNDGGGTITDRGVCWALTPSPSIESGSHLSIGNGTGSFSGTITGLAPNTPYYVRAYATNVKGTSYGEQKTFTTSTGLPTVLTTALSNITAISATCGGNVTDNGGFPITARGICWNTTGYPDINDQHTSNGTGNGSFIGNMTGLSVNTTYYVRAYATNNMGTAYGENITFTTSNGLPIVVTTSPTVNGTTVITGGNVFSDGGYAVTSRGICYGTTPYPDMENASHTTNGSGIGFYTSQFSATGATITTYYIRAYATNEKGTAYGEQKTVGPYDCLPSFEYNGHTYKVAPDPDINMTWSNANAYCQQLSLYGKSGWSLPTKEQLVQMYSNKNTIGGFADKEYWSSSGFFASGDYVYFVHFSSGIIGSTKSPVSYRVRPIRMDD